MSTPSAIFARAATAGRAESSTGGAFRRLQRSLELQGGIFTDAEATAFIAQPRAEDAVRVRLWDDLAKSADAATPGVDHYLAIARRLRR
jgi:predicted HD phosphohydrolase